MLLSTAIRKGMKMTGRCEGTFISGNKTCAIGAALYACGKRDSHKVGTPFLNKKFPYINNTVQNPVTTISSRLCSVAYDLNDKQHWSRSRIANFVEKQEKLWKKTGVLK